MDDPLHRPTLASHQPVPTTIASTLGHRHLWPRTTQGMRPASIHHRWWSIAFDRCFPDKIQDYHVLDRPKPSLKIQPTQPHATEAVAHGPHALSGRSNLKSFSPVTYRSTGWGDKGEAESWIWPASTVRDIHAPLLRAVLWWVHFILILVSTSFKIRPFFLFIVIICGWEGD